MIEERSMFESWWFKIPALMGITTLLCLMILNVMGVI